MRTSAHQEFRAPTRLNHSKLAIWIWLIGAVALALLPLLFLVGCSHGPTLQQEYQAWPLKPYPQTQELSR